jgi:cytochrome c oxidase subunit 1
MPSPSYWPVVIAVGVALIAGGILSHFALSFIGGAIVFLGIVGWGNEPAAAPQPHH